MFSKTTRSAIAALLATTAVCCLLSLTGLTNKSFGYIAFLRIWQGKAILMTLLLPLFVAYSIDFFRQPRIRAWLKLLLTLITGLGLSASSLFLLPTLAIALGMGHGFVVLGQIRSQAPPSSGKSRLPLWRGGVTLLGYFGLFLPLVLVGHFYVYSTFHFNLWQLFQRGGIPSESMNLFFADHFWGQYESVFGSWYGSLSLVWIALMLFSVWGVRGSARLFLVGWLVGAVIFLNPITFPVISQFFTTNNAYWRLFYILPFPLVVGIPFIYLYHRLDWIKALLPDWSFASNRQLAYRTIAGLVIGAIAINLLPTPYSLAHRSGFGWFRHKIDPALEQTVQQVLAVSPPGGMLAPFELSQKIPIYSADHPQVATHFHMLLGSAHPDDMSQFNSVLRAIALISQPNSSYINAYVRPLAQMGDAIELRGINDLQKTLELPVQTVVIAKNMEQRSVAQYVLRQSQFSLRDRTDDYLIYVKDPSPQSQNRVVTSSAEL